MTRYDSDGETTAFEHYDFTLAELPSAATHAIIQLTTRGPSMPSTITVDDANKKIALQFDDDKGDTDAAAPANAVGVVTVDNPAVLPLTADASNPFAWDIAGQTEGTATVTVTVNDATTGAPLQIVDATGATVPFGQPAPLAVTVGAGGAVSATEVVE